MSITRPNATQRLARLVNQPGGSTLAEAVRAADNNLANIREEALAEIDAMLNRMHASGAALPTEPTSVQINQLYALSNSIIGVAGLFDLGHLGAVAYSLCELLDRLKNTPDFNMPAVQVHLDSLRLLQAVSCEDLEQINAVQSALRRVVNRFPKAPESQPR